MSDVNVGIEQKVELLREKYAQKIAAIRKTGAERLRQIDENAPDPSDFEAALNFTFDVKWKITSIKFDIPKFSMEREVLKFDIPEVRMKTEEIKFDVPSTRMVRKCIAKKPVFRHWKWYNECIYAKVPEVYMKRVSFKTDIPKFNSKRVDIKFDKPVVKMEPTEIKLHLPHFYLKKLDVQIEGHKNEIEDVASDMTSEISVVQIEMKSELEAEIGAEISLMFDELRDDIIKERDNVSMSYEEAISKTKAAINILKGNNATDEVTKLETQLSKIVEDYKNILADLDATIKDISKQEEEALRSLRIA